MFPKCNHHFLRYYHFCQVFCSLEFERHLFESLNEITGKPLKSLKSSLTNTRKVFAVKLIRR